MLVRLSYTWVETRGVREPNSNELTGAELDPVFFVLTLKLHQGLKTHLSSLSHYYPQLHSCSNELRVLHFTEIGVGAKRFKQDCSSSLKRASGYVWCKVAKNYAASFHNSFISYSCSCISFERNVLLNTSHICFAAFFLR